MNLCYKQPDLVLIEQADGLAALCERLRPCSWLAVDTEFERSRTYYPQLCLLQLATAELTAIVDTQALADLSPLYSLLYDPGITLVLHAARQDLEIFFHIHNNVPMPLFDTQLAAGLLGHDAQLGYAQLVHEQLGVQLAKSATRTDWRRRPLSQQQLQYAADDVRYLSQLYPVLRDKLTAAGRLAEHEALCRALALPQRYLPDPDTLWQKLPAAHKFQGQRRAVLQRLTAWRERTARAKNLPRQWVLPNQVLAEMAHQLPDNKTDLLQTAGMSQKIARRYGEQLLRIIQAGRES